MPRPRPQGAALIELLTSVSLLGLILALGFTSLRPQQERASTQALAQLLVGALERAAAQAKADNTPVALALPSGGATSPLSQAYYLLQGSNQPRMERLHDLRRELPSCAIFAGFWDQDGSPVIESGLRPKGTGGERFDLSLWNPPQPQDSLLVFTPGGGVVSNLPRIDQSFFLVCCRGARWTAASAAGQPSFRLEAVNSPWTVQISATGKVDLISGLPRVANVALDPSSHLAGAAAVPSVPHLAANQQPHAPQVRIDPQPDPDSLPPGVDALVPVDGYLTLEVTCNEPDGERPRLSWQASGGSLSHAEALPMEWDSVRQLWTSHWTWSPPDGDPGGNLYSLNCTLTDPRGGTSTGQVGVHGRVQSNRTDKLVYWEEVDPPTGPNYTCVVVANPDGSERIRLTGPALNAKNPLWSPNGQYIYFIANGPSQVMSMKRDGSDLRPLCSYADVGGSVGDIEVSSDGSKLFLCRDSHSQADLYELRINDLNLRLIKTGAAGETPWTSLCPASPYWLLQSVHSGTGLLATDPASNTSLPVDTGGLPVPVAECTFSPTGRFFTWCSHSELWMADFATVAGVPTLSNRRLVLDNIHGSGRTLHSSVFSPNEGQLLFNVDYSAITLWKVNTDGSSLQQLTNVGGDVVNSDDGSWSTH